MKKIIGILVVAVFTTALFFSSNTINDSDGELNLLDLISNNIANAETIKYGCHYTGWPYHYCTHQESHQYVQNCINQTNASSCATII